MASDLYATVGGGRGNEASGTQSTIGGGQYNTASGTYCVISGGTSSVATGLGSTVGGGLVNSASGDAATVSGGFSNLAPGAYSMVAGGSRSSATGQSSFAAGRRAKANHDGAFVWADGFDADKVSSAINQFNVYASGGTRIFSDTTATAGVLLAPGGGSWTSVSDRNAKKNLEEVDGQAVLDKLASIPISSWNYKSQSNSIRHMGPMAQDFYAAFGLGVNEEGHRHDRC